MDLLADLNVHDGLTILLATHSPDLAAAAGRIVHLRDGHVLRVDDRRHPAAHTRAAL